MTQAKIEFGPLANDALPILAEDHEILKALFANFDRFMKPANNKDEKGVLSDEIREGPTVHSLVEEEIFYPRFARRLRAMT